MAGWGGPWSSLLRRLSIPQDAGPDDPRIVLGPDIPSELTAYYGDSNITSAIIFWIDGERYAYSAVIANPGGPYRVDGVVNMNRAVNDRVNEAFSYFLEDVGDGRVFIGGYDASPTNPANPTVGFQRETYFDEAVSMFKTLAVAGKITGQADLEILGTTTYSGPKRDEYFSAVSRAAVQAAAGAVSFTTVDREGFGVPVVNVLPSTAPIVVGAAGWYLVTLRTIFVSGPLGGVRAVALLLNGAFAEELKVTGVAVAQDQSVPVTFHRFLNVGDTLGVNVFVGGLTGGAFAGTKSSFLSAKLESV